MAQPLRLLTQATLLRHLAVTMAEGVVGTTSGAGTTTTAVDARLERYPNKYFTGWEIFFESGNLADLSFIVSDFVGVGGTLTFVPTGSGASGTSVRYIMLRRHTIDFLKRIILDAWRQCRDACLVPWHDESVTLIADTYDYELPYEWHYTGLASSSAGTAFTLIDTTLAEANDFWNGALLVNRTNSESRIVSDYVLSTTKLTWIRRATAAGASDTYDLHKFYPVAITSIQYYDDDGEWQEVPREAWDIRRSGDAMQLHLFNVESDPRYYRVWPFKAWQLRLTGWRYALEPTNSWDPIELPDQVIIPWCNYLFHASSVGAASMDPRAHAQRMAEAFRLAEENTNKALVIIDGKAART